MELVRDICTPLASYQCSDEDRLPTLSITGIKCKRRMLAGFLYTVCIPRASLIQLIISLKTNDSMKEGLLLLD